MSYGLEAVTSVLVAWQPYGNNKTSDKKLLQHESPNKTTTYNIRPSLSRWLVENIQFMRDVRNIKYMVKEQKRCTHPVSRGVGQNRLCHSITVVLPTQPLRSRLDSAGHRQASTVTHHPVNARHVRWGGKTFIRSVSSILIYKDIYVYIYTVSSISSQCSADAAAAQRINLTYLLYHETCNYKQIYETGTWKILFVVKLSKNIHLLSHHYNFSLYTKSTVVINSN